MIKCRRHIIAIIFSSLLVLPVLFILTLQLRQWQLQQIALERLEEEALETIIIPAGKLVWEKKNKEINLHGELFDVKSIRTENSNCIITGLYDRKETALKKILGESGRSQNSLISLLVFGQIFIAFIWCLAFGSLRFKRKNKYSFFEVHFHSFFKELHAPPPRLILFQLN